MGDGTGKSAVVLLSGGMDSTTVLALAVSQGYEAHALTVRYGQLHAVELEAARRVAKAYGAARHLELGLDLRAIGGSALTGDEPVPTGRSLEEIGGGIPSTYVPARNTILLALALGWAEVVDAADLFVGVSAVDYSGYPDCRPAFIAAFEALANLATRQGVEGERPFQVHAPLIDKSKVETIRLGQSLGVDYGLTWTCYRPQKRDNHGAAACGACDACRLRLQAFAEVGTPDPLRYAE